MAENRFKKSIENATDNTTDNTKNNIKDNIRDSAVDNTIDNIKDNILKKALENGKKGKGGNHTLYLSADVGDALVRYAKEAKKSKSALADEILREVLVNNQ